MPRQADGEITPEMIEAGERAYESWYAAGGADDHTISFLVRTILFEALEHKPSAA
jgi:hypothetical protein